MAGYQLMEQLLGHFFIYTQTKTLMILTRLTEPQGK